MLDDGRLTDNHGHTVDFTNTVIVMTSNVGSQVIQQITGEGGSEEEIRERTPDDIPVLVDDDIIARQLREAALAEEDPELRERLWEEYRKYNGI